MNKKKLLYLNLSTNEKDVSLGFSNTWISKFSIVFESIDLITLNKATDNQNKFNNVNIYGISELENLSKIAKFLKLKK